jgi:hypothetical protein
MIDAVQASRDALGGRAKVRSGLRGENNASDASAKARAASGEADGG